MKLKSNHLLAIAAAAMVIGFCSSTSALAQGADRAEFRQRMLDGYRDRLDVKSDEDWKKIEVLLTKVMDAQRDARMGMGFGFGGRGGRGGGDGAQGGGNRNRGGANTPAETEALTKAVEDKASADEVKAKVAAFREARKTKEAALTKAQEDLRKALTPRQEAAAILAGLLK